jgi:hypothetical protein
MDETECLCPSSKRLSYSGKSSIICKQCRIQGVFGYNRLPPRNDPRVDWAAYSLDSLIRLGTGQSVSLIMVMNRFLCCCDITGFSSFTDSRHHCTYRTK